MDMSKANWSVGDILKTGWNTPINLYGKFCSVVITYGVSPFILLTYYC